MTTVSMSCKDVARSLVENGYAYIDASSAIQIVSENIFRSGELFFSQSHSIKSLFYYKELLGGYYVLGSEYSIAPDRPDLCESFVVNRYFSGCYEALNSPYALNLPSLMVSALEMYDFLTRKIVGELQNIFDETYTENIDITTSSCLQLNYYKPSEAERDMLQEPHEDGHLLTLLQATSRGAEIYIDGEFIEADQSQGRILIMPGSILTAMTGGAIPALVHRVCNSGINESRQSLMYFVNPSIKNETTPWITRQLNSQEIILQMTLKNSTKFDLPSLSELDHSTD